jgi:alpha-L-fucosidase
MSYANGVTIIIDHKSPNGVRFEEALGERVQRFEFQYRAGAEWKTLYTGSKLGRWHQQKLDPPVKAREFRLNILDATDGPTICEFELFKAQ